MESSGLLSCARKLAAKCSVTSPVTVSGIDAKFISRLYEKICQPYLEDPPLLPTLSLQPKEHVAAILESLSCNFLNLDLDPVLNVEGLLAGDERSLLFLFRIFDNLYDCLAQGPSSQGELPARKSPSLPQQKPSASWLGPVGPTYMGRRISEIRSASVFYSPRTMVRRPMKRSKTVQGTATKSRMSRETPVAEQKTATISSKQTRSDEFLAQRRSQSQEKVHDSHALKTPPILHRHRSAIEKRRARIVVEAAKASIRNSSIQKRHVAALTKRTMDGLVLKRLSMQLKLEHAKEQARKVLLEQMRDPSTARANDRQRLRLLQELGDGSNIDEKSHQSSKAERAAQNKELRSLLSDVSSNLWC